MSERPTRARIDIVDKVVRGLWPDAKSLVEVVVEESRGISAWRPGRAALLLSAAPRVWMTSGQFYAWLHAQNFLHKRTPGAPKPIEAVGIASRRRLALLKGDAQVTKLEALAMAHYAAGIAPPIEPDDVPAFSAWVGEKFGASRQLAAFLEVHQSYIQDRVRGFDIQNTRRIPRLPDITLIRAMDWVLRFGPFCPYGEPADVELFPAGQEE